MAQDHRCADRVMRERVDNDQSARFGVARVGIIEERLIALYRQPTDLVQGERLCFAPMRKGQRTKMDRNVAR